MDNDYGNWLLVIANIVLFLYFIKSAFKPRTKTDWTTFRYFGAFIVALFAEMYGFPYTWLFPIVYKHHKNNILTTETIGYTMNI